MSGATSFVIALLAAIAGCLGSGFVANLCVGWYRVSSREGAAGFFVLSLGLVGGAAAFVVGLIAARLVAASAHAGFVAGLGAALGSVAAILGAVAVAARLLADVPPMIDGETLWVKVEARLPEGAERPGQGAHLTLATFSGSTARRRERGALFAEDARLEEGRWIVPGAVELFTERGGRLLEIATAAGDGTWFPVPIPRHPGTKELAWSDWLPRARPDGKPPATPITYRFRVQKQSEPVRVETFGPFEIATISSGFFPTIDPRLYSTSRFAIRSGTAPVAFNNGGRACERVDDVVSLPGPRPALLVHAAESGGSGAAFLVVADGASPRVTLVTTAAGSPIETAELTSDEERFRASRETQPDRGWFDRRRMTREGFYLVGQDAILDTRTMAARSFRISPDVTLVWSVPPLGISPDGRSFVRFGYAGGSESRPVLAVIDTLSGKNDLLPIDPVRMPFASLEALDPVWVAERFAWVRRDDGVDRLAER